MVPNEKVKVWKNIAAVIGNCNRRSILGTIKFHKFLSHACYEYNNASDSS